MCCLREGGVYGPKKTPTRYFEPVRPAFQGRCKMRPVIRAFGLHGDQSVRELLRNKHLAATSYFPDHASSFHYVEVLSATLPLWAACAVQAQLRVDTSSCGSNALLAPISLTSDGFFFLSSTEKKPSGPVASAYFQEMAGIFCGVRAQASHSDAAGRWVMGLLAQSSQVSF